MLRSLRPEHGVPPRPDFSHRTWLSLDGWWDFLPLDAPLAASPAAFLSGGSMAGRKWERIRVPYPWPAPASGQRDPGLEYALYRRRVTVPTGWRDRMVTLWFGGVIESARVWVNGVDLGEHVGGYEPFCFILPAPALTAGEPVAPELEILVAVTAPADRRHLLHGKQRSCPPAFPYDDCAFTRCGGIWQPVWLEATGRSRLDRCRFFWNPQDRTITARVYGRLFAPPDPQAHTETGNAEIGDLEVTMVIHDPRSPEAPGWRATAGCEPASPSLCTGERVFVAAVTVELPAEVISLWSPENPHLYPVEFILRDAGLPSDYRQDGRVVDHVDSYIGLRTVSVSGRRVLLNGEPIFLKGVLDQGFWPETLYAPPDDAAIRRDLLTAKRLGFNLVRKHLKLEDPRFLYWADRLGMLVWEELPSASSYAPQVIAGTRHLLNTMVERDANHPSIVIWGIFNEEWGLNEPEVRGAGSQRLHEQPDRQQVVRELYNLARSLDGTRPVVDNSGWNHVQTDIADYHLYEGAPERFVQLHTALGQGQPLPLYDGRRTLFVPGEEYSGQPVLCSEFGVGTTAPERAWQFLWQANAIRLSGAAGYVVTELYDIEQELAGLYHYDRSPKPGLDRVREANQDLFLALAVVPVSPGVDMMVHAGERLEIPVTITGRIPTRIRTSGETGVSSSTLVCRWYQAINPSGKGRKPVASLPASRISLPVPLGNSSNIVVTATAPLCPGRYRLYLAMVSGGVTWSYRRLDVEVIP